MYILRLRYAFAATEKIVEPARIAYRGQEHGLEYVDPISLAIDNFLETQNQNPGIAAELREYTIRRQGEPP